MSKQVKTKCAIFTLCVFLVLCSFAHAELKIDSVYPTIGKMGEPLNVTIKGSGFDKNTRLSMAVDSGNSASIIGSVDTPGLEQRVTVVGSIAYIAADGSGLHVVDISNPAKPAIIGSVDTPKRAYGVTVFDSIAYVADRESGLQVIDVSDPKNPIIIGSIDTPDRAAMVEVFDNRAYVADINSGLQVVDISDPKNPKIIGSVDTPGFAMGVRVHDNKAYVADGYSGLQVIDISDPTKPVIIGSVDTPSVAYYTTIIDKIAYVADGYSGLQVIDISDPTKPVIIGSVDTPDKAYVVTVVGNTAYVADSSTGLQVIDISDPENPKIIGSINTPGYAEGLDIVGNTAYVADINSIEVIDISKPPKNPTIIGSVDTPGYSKDVTVAGSTAYVADLNSLKVIDISNPTNPKIIGYIDTPGDAQGVIVADRNAYVANHSGLLVIDISDSTNPKIIGSVDTKGTQANDVAVVGNTAYVADGYYGGLQVIDISEPTNPKIIGWVDTPDMALGVTVSGNTAYVADRESGLQVIDISNPKLPVIIGSIDTPGSASAVTVSGNMAFVADTDGLQVIDISNPKLPVIIGSVVIPGFSSDVTVIDNKAYVAGATSGIQVVDISDPKNPIIIGSVDTLGQANRATVINNMAYSADGSAGLVIVSLPIEVTPTIIDSNIISVTLPSPQLAGNYNIRVFNSSGASSELRGGVSFLQDDDYQQKTEMKAIIVLGGKYPNNAIWEETRLCANFAYKTLLSQGYTHENIYYLSDEPVDVDKDGFTDVDGSATSANISYAINEWALDASELLLYMVDHGGDGYFVLSKTEKYFKATDLDKWLDNLQSTMTGRVVVVYDACFSGSFIPLMTPPPGKRRIVLTSASANEQAWFATQGILSFSYQFWASAYMKGNLYDAYLDAKHMVATFEKPSQNPMLDADGNGTGPDKDDQRVVSNIAIGRGRSAAAMPPEILEVSPDETLYGETFAEVWAKIDVNALSSISRVFAVVKSPQIDLLPSDQAVADLPEIELVDANGDGIFDGSYNDFKFKGEYTLYVYAVDKEGVYSTPQIIKFNQTKGLSPNVNLTPTHTILTDSSPSCSVASGEYVKVFGSSGVNTVNVASGARVECINFPGQNQININESSSNFTVKRSGATVYLQSSTGTMVKIPATLTSQTIKFTTDSRSFTLVISNSGTGGKVKLGSLEVGLTEMKL